jgi:hypothetical protein
MDCINRTQVKNIGQYLNRVERNWENNVRENSTNIMFLDVIHRPLFISKAVLFICQNKTFRGLDFVSVCR